MIQSILDTDLYKFSMSYAYFKLFPLAEGTFTFNDRNQEVWDVATFEKLQMEFYNLQFLKLSATEKYWCIEHIPYIPKNYWEWLSTFAFDFNKIELDLDNEGHLHIEITDNLYKVTLYEIAVLSAISEVRNSTIPNFNMGKVLELLEKKITFANQNNIFFSDFGTRRRFSAAVQNKVLAFIKENSNTCTGTSNVYYAMKFNMTPTGTMAHEWIMFHAGCFGFKRANYLAMEDWANVYDGNLGTALVDTYTTSSFLRTLTRKQAHLFAGFRQDSGDEFKVGNSIIARLKEFGIDPKSKTIVFSNALNFYKAQDIAEYFNRRCKVAFGIGTNLTCDPGIENYTPANIVMKLSKCRMSNKDPWEKVIKISDDLGKHMGDSEEFEIATHELHLNID